MRRQRKQAKAEEIGFHADSSRGRGIVRTDAIGYAAAAAAATAIAAAS